MKKIALTLLTLGLLFYAAAQNGCTNPVACNYDVTATVNDGSCKFPGEPCNDEDPETGNDIYLEDCTCYGQLKGCMDENSCFYWSQYIDAVELHDPSYCIYPGNPCDDMNEETINDVIQPNCSCKGTIAVEDCMDSEACTYNPSANVSNDTYCFYPGEPCDDGIPMTQNDQFQSNCDCMGEIDSNLQPITHYTPIETNNPILQFTNSCRVDKCHKPSIDARPLMLLIHSDHTSEDYIIHFKTTKIKSVFIFNSQGELVKFWDSIPDEYLVVNNAKDLMGVHFVSVTDGHIRKTKTILFN